MASKMASKMTPKMASKMTHDNKNNPKFLNGHIYEYTSNFELNHKMFELPTFSVDYVYLDIRNKDLLLQYYNKYKGDKKEHNVISYGSEYCNLDNEKYNDLVQKKYDKLKLSKSKKQSNDSSDNNSPDNEKVHKGIKTSSNNLYFIRHEHSCANQLEKILGEKFKYKIGFPGIKKGLYQNKRGEYAPDPHLSYFGVKHGLCLSSSVKTLFDNKRINIYCSQLIRTAETAIVLFSYKSSITLHIIPYISEKRTWTGTNRDNEPTNMKNYLIKVNKFFKKFKKKSKCKLSSISAIFYDTSYIKFDNHKLPFERYSNKKELQFITKPNKKKFIKLFTYTFNNKSEQNIIITHSKFLQKLDSNYKNLD